MYLTHYHHPDCGLEIIRTCESHGDITSRMWSQYQEENAMIAEKQQRFLKSTGVTEKVNMDIPRKAWLPGSNNANDEVFPFRSFRFADSGRLWMGQNSVR